MTRLVPGILCAFLLWGGSARPAGRCQGALGLDLGPNAGTLAATDDGLELLATQLLIGRAGDLLAVSESAGLETRATFDGLALLVHIEGPCPAVVDVQRARLNALLEPRTRPASLAQSAPPRLTDAPALAALRASVPLARAAHLALGARAPRAASDAHELIGHLLDEAPILSDIASLRSAIPGRRLPQAPPPPRIPDPQVLALPPRDGLGHLALAWTLSAHGALAEALLAHPGTRFSNQLLSDHALASSLRTAWFPALGVLVLEADILGDDPRPARDRIFEGLANFVPTPTEVDGAIALTRAPAASPATLGAIIASELTPSRATVLHTPPRADALLAFPIVDAALVARWVAASVDLRCPALGETPDRMDILRTVHDFDPRSFLALSRILGRDLDAMQQLHLEVSDRCNELEKLRKILPPRRLVALHREVVCHRSAAHTDHAFTHLARACRKFGIDPSAYRPLVAMARREPNLRDEIQRIDDECGGTR